MALQLAHQVLVVVLGVQLVATDEIIEAHCEEELKGGRAQNRRDCLMTGCEFEEHFLFIHIPARYCRGRGSDDDHLKMMHFNYLADPTLKQGVGNLLSFPCT